MIRAVKPRMLRLLLLCGLFLPICLLAQDAVDSSFLYPDFLWLDSSARAAGRQISVYRHLDDDTGF